MILIGACRQLKRRESAVVVAEAALFGGQKRYRLYEIDARADAGPSRFAEAIRQRIENGSLRRRKRIFSQDRRPPKTVAAPPKVVALQDGAGIVERLRARQVVVEAVCLSKRASWEKRLVGKALGADYTVGPKDLLAAARAVFAEGRIDAGDLSEQTVGPGAPVGRLSAVLAGAKSPPWDDLPAAALALALFLWFRETVPYRRAYRAK